MLVIPNFVLKLRFHTYLHTAKLVLHVGIFQRTSKIISHTFLSKLDYGGFDYNLLDNSNFQPHWFKTKSTLHKTINVRFHAAHKRSTNICEENYMEDFINLNLIIPILCQSKERRW